MPIFAQSLTVTKGVIDIEFIMATVLFLGSLSFTMLAIGGDFFSFREAAAYDNLMLDSRNVLHLLVFDEGEPTNWDAGEITSIKRLGLSSGNDFVLDAGKIGKLQALCSKSNPDYAMNYEKIRELAGVKGDVVIDVNAIDGTPLLGCGPGVETLSRPKFSSEGYAVVASGNEKKIVTITITVIA